MKRDTLVSHFSTEQEGDCPSHCVVMKGGRFFTMQCYDKVNDKVLGPKKIMAMLKVIEFVLLAC